MSEQFQNPIEKLERATMDTPSTQCMAAHFPGLVHAQVAVVKLFLWDQLHLNEMMRKYCKSSVDIHDNHSK